MLKEAILCTIQKRRMQVTLSNVSHQTMTPLKRIRTAFVYRQRPSTLHSTVQSNRRQICPFWDVLLQKQLRQDTWHGPKVEFLHRRELDVKKNGLVIPSVKKNKLRLVVISFKLTGPYPDIHLP